MDFSNNYGGWVELYNPATTAVSLSGWYVSDDADLLTKHRLEGYKDLSPGCYQCIFFDHHAADGEYGPDAAKQVRFKLNRNGGTLYLSRNGTDIDLTVNYPAAIPRCSYARVALETDEWQYCGRPTPGLPNAGCYAQECLEAPIADCDSRLFTSAFDVHIQIPRGTTLRYTTDGSTPTLTNGTTSTDGLFPVSQTTVLRLRLFAADKLPSSVVTRTYIYKNKDYYLPIVAVATDPLNLYDNTFGCYVDGTNGIPGRGLKKRSNLNMDWERPVNFEYLTADGRMVINEEASFEVAGGYSRHFKPASFKVQAKKLYGGSGRFGYPVFAGKPYQEYKQLLIRNGGNNNQTDGGARVKDAITQQVLTTSGFYVDAQEYQPAHVFINGRYLAMMNVREPNNRFHGCANYGYDNDETDGFEYSNGAYRQKGGNRDTFDRLIALSEDAETDAGYAEVCKLLDIDEFVRYMATICYTCSGDWLLNGNNVKGYRTWEDGKFHFVFFDQDLTWENTDNVEAIDGVTTNEVLLLYNNLKRNQAFRRLFVAAYCILHGSIYTPERCRRFSDSICALVKPALAFDGRTTTNTYNKLQKTMWEEKHREQRLRSLMRAYVLSDSIQVSINTDCDFARIQIEDIDVPFSKFAGVLFPPVSVATSAARGYRFVGWRDRQGRWLSRELACQITEGGTYTAVYEATPAEGISPVCINEVSAANDIYVNDYGKRADWLELYNRGSEPVNVAQWYFSDDEESPMKYLIDAAGSVNTFIPPNGHLVIWCDGKPSVTGLHLPFKLRNDGNSIITLFSADGCWRDSLHYSTHSSKETVGRFPDGGSSSRTFYHPTIGAHNSATTYDVPANPSPGTVLSPSQTSGIVNISYYSVNGIRISKPSRNGIYIKSVLYQNGRRQQSKVCIND